jgi:hypothetical protein
MKITIEIEIKKEGIGTSTLIGTLFQDLSDEGIDIAPINKIKNKKVIFIYDDSKYSHYSLGKSDEINGRELANKDIQLLREWGWEIEERNV